MPACLQACAGDGFFHPDDEHLAAINGPAPRNPARENRAAWPPAAAAFVS
ncbi:hypothetical protein OPIT5_28935 [Opitutaceae bacterium TAV5]|nr:hypothetical protein OPIT5_28935 [Opitutaceae bacterium TAV5]